MQDSTDIMDKDGNKCQRNNEILRLGLDNVDKDNVEECAIAVKAKSECSISFFYAPDKGWCKCEMEVKGYSCTRHDNGENAKYYNEYRIEGT